MVINRMAADEMRRVRSIMVASGGIKKMLQAAGHHDTPPSLRGACCGPSQHPPPSRLLLPQGSWWLTVTQFCIDGMVEGVDGRGGGEALATHFAETLLDELISKDGMLRLTAKEVHSFDSVAAFASLLKHARKVSGHPRTRSPSAYTCLSLPAVGAARSDALRKSGTCVP